MRGFTAETGRSLAGSPGAAYVDHTAILADEVNAFIGFNSLLFNCKVGNHSVVRHNSVVEECTIPERFYKFHLPPIFTPVRICAGSSKFRRK